MESQRKLSGSTEVSSMVDGWKGNNFHQDNLKCSKLRMGRVLEGRTENLQTSLAGPTTLGLGRIFKKEKKETKNCTLMFWGK